ncbi:hypothetical protein DNTS_021812 [Danionella cerebrum]|uniref:Uncharacterized protein n=1 Tax=Danionella cerebrum TaxID=2873325 RepID=A0A553R896_9TELE|nr:hypothetical protein DNTS_021812 [Danionella translucida]
MESASNKASPISPQKQTVKNRSKSIDEVQQAKKETAELSGSSEDIK